MHKNVIDITGERFGHLIAKYPYSIRDKLGRVHWVCKCDCGNTILVRGRQFETWKHKTMH
jgi:hypothetical protein